MSSVMLAFLVEVGIVTWRDVAGSPQQKQGHTIHGLPLPADYLAAVMLFGALGLVPKSSGAAKIASLTAWGIVIATALNYWSPGSPFYLGKSQIQSTGTPAQPTKQGAKAA